MPSRRSSIALTEEEQKDFLENGGSLQVASIGPNGYPHLVAMWYGVVDGLVHFTTYGKSQKILNLRRNPKISVMLESGRRYAELKGLVIEGTAEIIDDPETTLRAMQAIGSRYESPAGAGPLDAEGARRAASKRVTVRIHPVKVYSWDHSKLGGRY
jgi:PPOX class probable F420-dependent enzyme